MLTLSAEQRTNVERIAAEPSRAALVGSETGTGKTVTAVEVARALGASTVLIIAPPGTMSGWRGTFAGQGIDLPFREISSKTPDNFTALSKNEPGIYFVGREFMHLSATSLAPKQREDGTWTNGRVAKWSWSKVKPDLAVYDEVQAVSNRWSNGFKVLKTIVPRFKIAMSATPAGNRFMGIWPVCRWLWPKDRNPAGDLYVDNSQWRWAAQWGVIQEDRFAGRKVTGERVPGAFVASLPCYVRQEADRVPETVYKVAIELTPVQRQMYNQMEAQSLAWLDENPLVADIPITQRIRLRQMSLGEVSFAEDDSIDFKDDCESAKIDACLKIIARHPGRSVVFWTDSQKFARVLAKRLPETVEWSGAVPKAERERIRGGFGTAPGVKHIAATIAAMGEGVDGLQHVSNVQVWCNKSENNMLNQQAEGRLNRQGQPENMIYTYELIALDTADDEHFNNLVKQTIAMRRSLTI